MSIVHYRHETWADLSKWTAAVPSYVYVAGGEAHITTEYYGSLPSGTVLNYTGFTDHTGEGGMTTPGIGYCMSAPIKLNCFGAVFNYFQVFITNLDLFRINSLNAPYGVPIETYTNTPITRDTFLTLYTGVYSYMNDGTLVHDCVASIPELGIHRTLTAVSQLTGLFDVATYSDMFASRFDIGALDISFVDTRTEWDAFASSGIVPRLAPNPPTIYPSSGNYSSLIYAGITAEQGLIRYTTDGTDPTATSEIYTRGIRVSGPMTIKAVTDLDGNLSQVATATYSVTGADLEHIPSYLGRCLPLLLQQYQGDNP